MNLNPTVRVFIGLELAPAIGDWIDVDPDPEVTQNNLKAVARALKVAGYDGAEKVSVMDTDEFPGRSSNLTFIQTVVTAADIDGAEMAPLVAYAENDPSAWNDPSELAEGFREVYQGWYADRESFGIEMAQQIYDSCDLTGPLASYIDWDRYSRDLFLGGDYWDEYAGDGGIWVFRSY